MIKLDNKTQPKEEKSNILDTTLRLPNIPIKSNTLKVKNDSISNLENNIISKSYSYIKNFFEETCTYLSSIINTICDFFNLSTKYNKFFISEKFKSDRLIVKDTTPCLELQENKKEEKKESYFDKVKEIDSFFFLNKPYIKRNILDFEDPRDGIKNNQPKIMKK